MRDTTVDIGFLKEEESGHIFGFNLGFDFCAEHEWGIKDLRKRLGMPSVAHFKDWTDIIIPTQSDKSILFAESKITKKGEKIEYSVLATNFYYDEADALGLAENQFRLKAVFRNNNDPYFMKNDFLSAWDSKNFIIVGFTEVARQKLRDLRDALFAGKVTVSQGKAIFGGGGLILGFNDKIPQKYKIDFNEQCDDSQRLRDAADATGIVQKLNDARQNVNHYNDKLGYFALSPRWKDKAKKEVWFWLNPYDQKNNNFGWFTVADLEAWIEGKGPILKNG